MSPYYHWMEEPEVGSVVTYLRPHIYEQACNNLGEEFNFDYKARVVECISIVESEYMNHKYYDDLMNYFQQSLNQLNKEEK